MALNLIELTTSRLGGLALAKLSEVVGESSAKTQTAIAGMVPTVIASVAAKADSPEGAESVMNTLQKMDWENDLLDDLPGFLGKGGHESLLSAGSAQAKDLLGGRADNVADAVAKMAGIDGSKATSLLGLVTPIALSVVGKQQNDLALDTGGLVKLLADQKDNIANALPPDLAHAMGNPELAGLAEQAQKLTSSAKAAAEEHGSELHARLAAAGSNQRSGGSSLKWLVWLVIVGVILYMVYQFILKEPGAGNGDPAAPPPAVESTPTPKPAN